MTLVKNINCVIDVSTSPGTMGELPVTWYDQDLNTAQITIQVVRNGAPVMLPADIVTPYLTLAPLDGSKKIFNIQMGILDQTNGVLQYVLGSDELKHPGKFSAQLRLAVPSQGSQVISVEFSFTVRETLVERLNGEGRVTDEQGAINDQIETEAQAYANQLFSAAMKRIDHLIIGSGGNSSAELTAAHVDFFGDEYNSIAERLDAIERFQMQKGRK